MSYSVCEVVLSIEGDNGQRIGIRTDGPSRRGDIGEGAASIAETIGIGNLTPNCRLEVRSDGAVWLK